MHLPSKAISQIGKIIEQRESNTGPRLFEGVSTPAVKALQNPGQQPSVAGTTFQKQMKSMFNDVVKPVANIDARPSLYVDNANSAPKVTTHKLG
jgi:hypothetical protein